MLVLIDPEHAQFVEERGTSVFELSKALYGCVEAAALHSVHGLVYHNEDRRLRPESIRYVRLQQD